MKLFLTSALAMTLASSGIAAEPIYAFETIGYLPATMTDDIVKVRDVFNSAATTERERSALTGIVARHSNDGVTDWAAVRAEYFAAREAAKATGKPMGDDVHFRRPSPLLRGVGQVVAGVVTVAAGAYVGGIENTYHTSSSFTDAHGRTVTVRCSTYVNGTTVDSSCN